MRPEPKTGAMLVLFSRWPRAGHAKTRLIPELGPEGAAALQQEMTGRTVMVARQAACLAGLSIQARHTGAGRERFRNWLGPDLDFHRQGRGDLGERMARAFGHASRHGAGRTVVIGTDCPGVSPSTIGQAFQALEEHEIVLGPAADGGYYLIGLRQPRPELFQGIEWGTDQVLAQTLARVQRTNVSFTRLGTLRDVDRPSDLAVWESVAGPRGDSDPNRDTVSVVIPALNEADHIAAAIGSARREAGDVIVVDGGSRDDTRGVALRHGARVISAPRGRAVQANAGALALQGGILLFLHADAVLPRGYAAYARRALGRPGVLAGAFRLKLDGRGRGLRMVEKLGNARSRWFRFPYSDQALFMRAAVFRRYGGFPLLPIMDDFDLVRRLRHGGRIVTLDAAVTSSARRWETLGVWRGHIRCQLVVAGYYLGMNPNRLDELYGVNREQNDDT